MARSRPKCRENRKRSYLQMRKNEVKAKVVVDVHEPINICTLLSEFDLEVERKSISPGDYIVGEGWAVERKTTGDFVQSLFKGRLLEQLDRLLGTEHKTGHFFAKKH